MPFGVIPHNALLSEAGFSGFQNSQDFPRGRSFCEFGVQPPSSPMPNPDDSLGQFLVLDF
jgi:hypothetical protein